VELLAPPRPRSPIRTCADFAVFNALAELHGPDWRRWPAELRRPGAAHWRRRRRTGSASTPGYSRNAPPSSPPRRPAGMRPGIIHDLAVGVDPGGADAWLLQDVMAAGVRIGRPPDAFKPAGQDWGLAAWRPDRLAAAGYARTATCCAPRSGTRAGCGWTTSPGCGGCGGCRPAARRAPTSTTDAAAMPATPRPGGAPGRRTVVGEDLGTVEPEVTEAAEREHQRLRGAVVRATKDGTGRCRRGLARRRPGTVNTHDCPPRRGCWPAST
jgi:4-alpha-glucanotransferase